jgi:PIN domain nuclease of toxin-antitoxin system
MKLLLDTHAFIWWDEDPTLLSAVALAAIRDPDNDVWASAVNPWEMAIKSQLGKLTLRIPLRDIVAGQRANGLPFLGVTPEQTLSLLDLPLVHKDPFDRLLAAQCLAEGLTLVTSDAVFAGYPIPTLW